MRVLRFLFIHKTSFIILLLSFIILYFITNTISHTHTHSTIACAHAIITIHKFIYRYVNIITAALVRDMAAAASSRAQYYRPQFSRWFVVRQVCIYILLCTHALIARESSSSYRNIVQIADTARSATCTDKISSLSAIVFFCVILNR